jgi:hypothetical protein
MSQLLPSNLDYEKYFPFVAAAATATVIYSTARMLASNNAAGSYQALKDIPSPKGYPVIGKLLYKIYFCPLFSLNPLP